MVVRMWRIARRASGAGKVLYSCRQGDLLAGTGFSGVPQLRCVSSRRIFVDAPVGVSCKEMMPASVSNSISRGQVVAGLARHFHSSPHLRSNAANSGQINQSEFTDMAWEGIIGAVEAARQNKQQVVETEHLMKALLEQKDGLARRIFAKAGVDNTSVLQATDLFINQQPKVVGDTSGSIIGSNLKAVLDNAKKNKKDFGDDFLSVEHLMLALLSDKRFGQQLFKNLQLGEKELKEAISAVRGNQKVTDQNPEGKYQALEKYGNDLTELARRGKLDPVIGRDDEIRRCIQILSRRTKNNPVIIDWHKGSCVEMCLSLL